MQTSPNQEDTAPCMDAEEYIEHKSEYEKIHMKRMPINTTSEPRHHFRLWFTLLVLGVLTAFWILTMWIISLFSLQESLTNRDQVMTIEGVVHYELMIFLSMVAVFFYIIILFILLGIAVRNGGQNKSKLAHVQANETICSTCGWSHSERDQFCPACGTVMYTLVERKV